jgi:hypothetical protein
MTTRIYSVPSGQSLVFPAPTTSSVCVQPGTGGTASIAYGPTPNGPFTLAPQGADTGVYSLCTTTYSGATSGNLTGMGNVGFVQVAATVATATVIVADMSDYPGSSVERQTVAMTGVAFTTIASSTAELGMFSMRFPANYFQYNFRLEWEAQITLTNSATVKTIKAYFGASTNSATAAALEGGTLVWSNVYTSMIGARFGGALYGRNDGQTIIASNYGLASAGGWGSSTTANVTISSDNYNAGASGVEQVFYITGTKATGTDTLTLDSMIVKVYQ